MFEAIHKRELIHIRYASNEIVSSTTDNVFLVDVHLSLTLRRVFEN